MKVKHGKSQEITDQLSERSATTFAQWIGCATVIYNQKTVKSTNDYAVWLAAGANPTTKPIANQQVAYLCESLPFLKEIPAQIRRNAGSKWIEAVNAAKLGLRSPPKVKPKNKKRNCYVTNELFDVQALDENRCLIQIKVDATQKNKSNYLCGVVMPFAKEAAGKAFYLSRKGKRFWLSMAYDKDIDVLCEQEIKSLVKSLSDEQLQEVVVGYDLGVKRQVTGSNDTVFHLPQQAQEKIQRLEKRKKRYQRRYARMAKANDKHAGTKKRKRTNGEVKQAEKIAKYTEKKANIHQNNAHHLSKAIVANTPLVAVFEDIKLNNMVRKPKVKKDDKGRFIANGAAAKRGLNKAILSVNMGQIRQFVAYKLKESGKLFIKVKPHYSSQECEECGFTHKDNRKTQASFKCLQCGVEKNADLNASLILKGRGIKHIRSETFSQEKTQRKTLCARKTKKAQELASSGCGDYVRHAHTGATINDALNSQLIEST